MRTFSEVFPSLEYEGELKTLFENAGVERISAPPDIQTIRIHICLQELTDHARIREMESYLKEKLFRKRDVTIEIRERFAINRILSPEELYREYSPSLLQEVRERSMLEYRILTQGTIRFTADSLTYSLEDTDLNRHVSTDLTRFLERVFHERCGIPCRILREFTEPQAAVYEDVPEMSAPVTMKREAKDEEFVKPGANAWGAVPDSAKEKKKTEKPVELKSRKKSDNPEVLFGRDFKGTVTDISDIIGDIGEVIVRGQVMDLEKRALRKNDLTLYTFTLTDFQDSITVKMFIKPENIEEIDGFLKNGVFMKLKGTTTIDSYSSELIISSVRGIKQCNDFVHGKRMDHAELKRVELHCHTKMSEMDGVSAVEDIIQRAGDWGMDAIAVTDHGNVQSFPNAFHKVQKMGEKAPKILYGVEGYLVDDTDLKDCDPEEIRKRKTYHVIILIQNETGRVNLYRLISYAHIDFFKRRPRIPKSLLTKYREGLIVGSACEAGELCRALVSGADDTEIKRLVDFYDYLEIQPIGNNRFMIADENFPAKNEEDLRDLNRRIVRLGEQYGKPVCATCDVHFLDPEDEVYRRMIYYGLGFADADQQAPLYLRTTEEMLEEFAYLGREKAFEVVVTNTRAVADRIDYIEPVRPDKCPPQIPDSDRLLTEACYEKAHAQYGEQLPEIVENRLKKELNSIISNGFAVMYIIAKKLVEKSNSDGYLVGSRGSVGSSFAAYTSGITEVNPLPPHYYCTECKYSDFDSAVCKEYAGRAGCDMPDAVCPVCGSPLRKDGYDIPFETFLGFNGDKEPDIDLNFSGEYQSVAHAYTEVIFGKGHTFRAGTVGTLADKTAFGYVKKYHEEHNTVKRNCEINRLVKGCLGVKRTTGQHPGGIVVLPHGEEIYSFTPVQKPANDMTSRSITTHFEYHAIDHNLLKLDILGHQAPTMIRMLQDITGIDPVKDIPLDSRETMQLFKGTEILGIKPEDIGGCRLGSLGIPEFGTDFAIQMLIDADPQGFSDLVRIAGLAHGTDVWIGNAHDLIASGKATIQTAICTRDDIMIYLIQKEMDPGLSFKIMESVRKGKGLKPEWEQDMIAHQVPDWYIDSCKKIKYMFPKAHAAAYVMMSWRIAYCKIFYPLAYYCAYFSIMGNGFSYELMGLGLEKLRHEMEILRRKGDNMTDREQNILRDMRITEEMYVRGFEFLPIDLYKSKAGKFFVEDGKIRPCFTSIDGLGESVAVQIEEAAAQGRFLSKEDFRNRTRVSKTLCDQMDALGLLGDIPDTDQLSLFDL